MKLNTKKTIFVGFAFLLISMFWQAYDNILAKMLINSFGFNQTFSGAVLALDNVLALFLIPFFGVLSDRTRTKFGKRTPFIVIGVVIAALLFIGVAVADNYQQIAVKEANLPEIVAIKDGDNVIGYAYGDHDPIYVGPGRDLKAAEFAALELYRSDVWEIAQNNIGYLILFLGILLLVLIAMASFRSPAVSLMPDVTPKPLRSKANAIINLMGTVGALIALGLTFLLVKGNPGSLTPSYTAYIPTFIVLAVLMYLFLGLFLWKVKEPKLVEEMHQQQKLYGIEEEVEEASGGKMPPAVRKSFILILTSIVLWFMAYNAATTKFSIYAEDVLQMPYNPPLMVAYAVAAIFFIPIGIVTGKIGRKKTILTGIVILAFAFILGIIATAETKFLIFFTMGIAGIGWAAINVNSYPMVVEMARGSNIGKYTGYYYTASMAAQIVTPILSGAVMDYLLGRPEPRLLFPYSVFFCVIAFITMSFVKHGDSKPIPKSKLEAFADPEEA